ncbi:MAG: MBL fold metallo-hydrolase [Desulfoplanes sp.]
MSQEKTNNLLMTTFSIITQMPDEPGAFLKAAQIMRRYGANMSRISYDRAMDAHTFFMDITCEEGRAGIIKKELEAIGYLEKDLPRISILAIAAYVPDRSGELFDFLHILDQWKANITSIDFDNSGRHRDKVSMRLNIAGQADTDELLKTLQLKYRLDILEYDATGDGLDDTVFYIRFAQRLRRITGIDAEDLLSSLLAGTNHIAQELTALKRDTRQVFDVVLKMAERIGETKEHFFCDIETIPLTPAVTLHIFQLPTGSNIALFETPDEYVMIDTGYGLYFPYISRIFEERFADFTAKLRRIYITHADADHCGACGQYAHAVTWMNPQSRDVLRNPSRGYGSDLKDSVLEKVYTRLSHILSEYSPPDRETIRLFSDVSLDTCHGFSLIDHFSLGEITFEVLQGRGGHVHGEMIFLARDHGLIFTGDCLVNLKDMSRERAEYNKLADFLMTSVNVNSAIAREQRRALLEMIGECDTELEAHGKRMLVCGGHGPVSIVTDGRLEALKCREEHCVMGTPRRMHGSADSVPGV